MRSSDDIRARFPALAGEWALLENAGGSQVPLAVADAVRSHMLESYVQLGAGYPLSHRADEVVARAHAWSRTFVGDVDDAGGAERGVAILGPSTSQLCAMLAACVARTVEPGDNVVLAESGHEANLGPWAHLADRGVEVRWWRVDPDAQDCVPDGLDAVLDGRTRIVALPHVSNLLGAVLDVRDVARRAHAVGAEVVVDGVAFAPHRAVDVHAWQADWYVFSTYKVYGPHMAVLWGRREAALALEGPNHFFIPRDDLPGKFELGGTCHEACAGWNAVAGYLEWLADAPAARPPHAATHAPLHAAAQERAHVVAAFAEMERRELPLQRHLLQGLRELRSYRVLGPASAGPSRVPTVSFVHARRSSREIVAALHAAHVAVRHGHMYAHRLCAALGIDLADGVVRVSAVHYNTTDEIDRVLAVLRRLA